MRTSPNESDMPIASTRWSRFCRTRSSNPEYVWTMYQRFSPTAALTTSDSDPEETVHGRQRLAEHDVAAGEEEADDERRHDHDDRRVDDDLRLGPRDLLR